MSNPLPSRGVSQEPSLRLISAGLLSKWGFQDGDEPDEVWDYFEQHGIAYEDIDWHPILIKLVRAYLLPVLQHDVEVYELSTIHNPIRARMVDGMQINAYEESGIELSPEYVDVPLARVLELAERDGHA